MRLTRDRILAVANGTEVLLPLAVDGCGNNLSHLPGLVRPSTLGPRTHCKTRRSTNWHAIQSSFNLLARWHEGASEAGLVSCRISACMMRTRARGDLLAKEAIFLFLHSFASSCLDLEAALHRFRPYSCGGLSILPVFSSFPRSFFFLTASQ
jgi:hypothetical protein